MAVTSGKDQTDVTPSGRNRPGLPRFGIITRRTGCGRYPASTAIKLILDNHSAHISRETRTWLAAQVPGRFEFTFTPKHGSWLNLVEGFFSKFARSVLRHIRVASKQELKERIHAPLRRCLRRRGKGWPLLRLQHLPKRRTRSDGRVNA
jgi:transposase